jgi:hypothetical protein
MINRSCLTHENLIDFGQLCKLRAINHDLLGSRRLVMWLAAYPSRCPTKITRTGVGTTDAHKSANPRATVWNTWEQEGSTLTAPRSSLGRYSTGTDAKQQVEESVCDDCRRTNGSCLPKSRVSIAPRTRHCGPCMSRVWGGLSWSGSSPRYAELLFCVGCGGEN